MATLGDGEGPAVGREAKVVTGYEAAMQANNELESHRVGLERWYTIHTPPTEAVRFWISSFAVAERACPKTAARGT